MPAQHPLTQAEAYRLEAAYTNPETGSIKRRVIARLLNGIRPVGRQSASLPVAEPTKADAKARAAHDAEVAKRHKATIEAELAALDRHREDVSRRIEVLEGMSGSAPTFSLQELKAEYRQLGQLRQMLQDDLDHPIMVDRDGHPLDDNTRAYVKFRTAELRESAWATAERFSRSGDHRQARLARRDSLRARQVVEFEVGWRQSLPGYGLAVWQ